MKGSLTDRLATDLLIVKLGVQTMSRSTPEDYKV